MKIPDTLRNCLLSMYCYGTLPYRHWQSVRMHLAGRMPILSFFYHRVGIDRCVPWSHTFDEFQRQMYWLKDRFEMISLEEAQRRIRSGKNNTPAATITFDDGYAENCDRAIPFLIEEQIPCTYFVCSHFVFDQQCFPHDIARGYRLLPNTVQQLRLMADAGIEIGAHTRSHADMGKIHDPRRIEEEVSKCGDELEQALGRRVRYFAFPYGLQRNMTTAAFRMAREHGYEAVCSAYGDYNHPGDDGFHIRRIHADNMSVLRNWATFDPRKVTRPIAYDWQQEEREHATVNEVAEQSRKQMQIAE